MQRGRWVGRQPRPEDEHRWQQAFAVLAGAETDVGRRALRPAQRRTWFLVASVLLVALVAGAVVGVLVAGSPGRSSEPGWARQATGLALTAGGLAVIIASLVVRARQGRLTEAWRAPALVLDRRQRRSLVRQVRGSEPVDPGLLPLTRDTAVRLARLGQLVPLAGLVVQQAGTTLITDIPGYVWFFLSFVVLFLLVGALALWNRRCATRFLAEHPLA